MSDWVCPISWVRSSTHYADEHALLPLGQSGAAKPRPVNTWRVATAQEAFSELRARHLAPALRAMGFKVRSRKTWVQGAPGTGWVVADFGGNRRNTGDVGEWSVIVWGWPPGTWERQGLSAPEPDSRVAPLYAGPESVLGWVSGQRPDVVELVAGMTDEQIAEAAQVLLDYTQAACLWVETRNHGLRG